MEAVGRPLSRAERRRTIGLGLVRALAFTVLLTLVYFIAPLEEAARAPLWLVLTVGLVVVTAVAAYQVRAIVTSGHPAVRAVEAIAITGPLFLILFAGTYVVLSGMDDSSFSSSSLSRVDSLYFTVTVFSTVGFGDITATSQTARILVTVQMILDLIVIGAVVRVFVAAVGMARRSDAQLSEGSPKGP